MLLNLCRECSEALPGSGWRLSAANLSGPTGVKLRQSFIRQRIQLACRGIGFDLRVPGVGVELRVPVSKSIQVIRGETVQGFLNFSDRAHSVQSSAHIISQHRHSQCSSFL